MSAKADIRHMRVKQNLPRPFNPILPVQSSPKKFSVLPVGQIISTSRRRLVSQEGRLAIVTKREAGCGGRAERFRRERSLADGEVVWV